MQTLLQACLAHQPAGDRDPAAHSWFVETCSAQLLLSSPWYQLMLLT